MSGRCAASSDISATRAARFAERTDATVTPASTSVPPADESAEIVTQSISGPYRRPAAKTLCFELLLGRGRGRDDVVVGCAGVAAGRASGHAGAAATRCTGHRGHLDALGHGTHDR